MANPGISARIHHLLDPLRLRLSGQEGLVPLALLGLVCGLTTGAIIVAFRQTIELSQAGILPGGAPEAFETLGPWARLALCAGGGLVLGLAFQALPPGWRALGMVHVMERMSYHQGRMPLPNAVVQFLGGAVALICGHSVGREGPGIHLGAAAGNLTAVPLRLPNNALRTLTACGVAASIAASFNTPLAGVIFAMEVVMMEYTLFGFTPVVMAAVSATVVTQAVYGDAPAFSVPPLALGSLAELPLMVVAGVLTGFLAAAFIRLILATARRSEAWPLWLRMTLGGTATGVVAMAVPEVMGVGYDTLNGVLLGEYALGALAALVGAKLLATGLVLGLGSPGGSIAPTLFIGGAAGGALGVLVAQLSGAQDSVGLYALAGMGAMMAATLQAPLAALTAMLELTANPHIILPGMLALVTAYLVSREVLGTDSLFLMLMRARGLDYRNDPLAQSLRREGVSTAMERRVTVLPRQAAAPAIRRALSNRPRWVVVRDGEHILAVLAAADLARALEQGGDDASPVDLMEVPGDRRDAGTIPFEATLQEALEALDRGPGELLCVVRPYAPGIPHVYGVVGRGDVEARYHLGGR